MAIMKWAKAGGLVLTACLTGLRPAEANGFYLNGNQLLAICTSANFQENSQCVGYLEGAEDSLELARQAYGKPQCLPDTVVVRQVRDVVVKYLQDNPVTRDEPAITQFALAIGKAWGCN